MCDSSPHLLLMGLGVTLQDISRERKMICKLNSVERRASCRRLWPEIRCLLEGLVFYNHILIALTFFNF